MKYSVADLFAKEGYTGVTVEQLQKYLNKMAQSGYTLFSIERLEEDGCRVIMKKEQ